MPAALIALVPFAERWGIGDDFEREAAVGAASVDELEALVHCSDDSSTALETSRAKRLFILHGACANWDAALLLAKEKAGCESGQPGPPRCNCPLPAEICPYLVENRLPDAYILSSGVIGFSDRGATLFNSSSGTFAGVGFNDMLCGNNKPYAQGVTLLAKAMIHEALHAAKYMAGVNVPGTNDAWSRKYLGWNLTFDKDAQDITDSCFK